jgi:hypothetical protein
MELSSFKLFERIAAERFEARNPRPSSGSRSDGLRAPRLGRQVQG